MSLKWKRHRNRSALPWLLYLAIFFFVGIALGQMFAAELSAEAGEELKRYLDQFLFLKGSDPMWLILSALVLYFRYPLMAFLLGFSAIGILLIPCFTVAFGFFLSYAACCFIAVLGSDGLWVALAVSGLRSVVTLPCFLLLSVSSLETAAALLGLSFGNGRRSAPVVYGKDCWMRFLGCILVLLLGMCVELLVSPLLLQAVLKPLAL